MAAVTLRLNAAHLGTLGKGIRVIRLPVMIYVVDWSFHQRPIIYNSVKCLQNYMAIYIRKYTLILCGSIYKLQIDILLVI